MLWKSSHVHRSMTGPDHHYRKSALTHSYMHTGAASTPKRCYTPNYNYSLCSVLLGARVSMIHFAFYQRNRSAIKKRSVSHQA